MECRVYGMLVAAPIHFPNELELRVYPHDKATGLQFGGFYPYMERKSWQWVQSFVPLVASAWAEIEEQLKEGKSVALLLGEHSMDLPDGTIGPGVP